jgi:hypothetical protein
MKSRLVYTLVGVILALGLIACDGTIFEDIAGESVRGSGDVVQQDREVRDVTGVELAMQGTLQITTGGGEALRIEAEDNLLTYIETDVRGGKLVIETRSGINLRPTRPIRYTLTVGELKSIEVSSSGDVEAEELQSGSCSVRISSSGNVSIDSLECSSLQVDISSSGNLDISGGQVQEQDITISSSGEYRARNLDSVEAEIALTSSGTATIRVSNRLTGRLSSSGDVRYIGNPELDVRTTSSGRTERINE